MRRIVIGFSRGNRIERKKWMAGLSDGAKQTAFGWDTAECAGVVGKITAFLTARTVYETDNFTGNRVAKDEDKLVYGIHPADTIPT